MVFVDPNLYFSLLINNKQEGVRMQSCDEFNPRDKTFKNSQLKLTIPKSGFGVAIKNGRQQNKSKYFYSGTKKLIYMYILLRMSVDSLPLFLSDSIFVIGGNDGQNILSTVEQYDYRMKKVQQQAEMRERRDELAVTIGTDNKIYAIGKHFVRVKLKKKKTE